MSLPLPKTFKVSHDGVISNEGTIRILYEDIDESPEDDNGGILISSTTLKNYNDGSYRAKPLLETREMLIVNSNNKSIVKVPFHQFYNVGTGHYYAG